MNSTVKQLITPLVLGLGLTLGLLASLSHSFINPSLLHAAGFRYVAPASTGNDSGNDCTNPTTPCATIQHAVDVAESGDEIRVTTGTYTGVQARPRNDVVATGLVTQVVHISQSVNIRGDYTTSIYRLSSRTSGRKEAL